MPAPATSSRSTGEAVLRPTRDGFAVNRLSSSPKLSWDQNAPLRAVFRSNVREFQDLARRHRSRGTDWRSEIEIDPLALALQLLEPGAHPGLDWQRFGAIQEHFRTFGEFVGYARGRGAYDAGSLDRALQAAGVGEASRAYSKPLIAKASIDPASLGTCAELLKVYRDRAAEIGYTRRQFALAEDFIRGDGGIRRRLRMQSG